MELILYYAPLASSLVAYVALLEARAKFDVRVVNFKVTSPMSAAYLKDNPRHAVPVLVVDGQPLTGNVAILQWIADHHAGARLLPTEGLDRYRAIAFLTWCASGIQPFLTPFVLPRRYCDLPGAEANVRGCAQKMLQEKFQTGEAELAGRDWVFGDFSLADAYFFWCQRRAKQFNVDLSAYERCGAHHARMLARSSVGEVLAFEAKVIADSQK